RRREGGLRPLAGVRATGRPPALPRCGRRGRLRERVSRCRAARRRNRARSGLETRAGRRIDRALHPLVVKLAAVVLNWNGGDDTLAALESLDGIETVCVDNGSDDGSPDAIAARFPGVELIRTGVNLGLPGGNNV